MKHLKSILIVHPLLPALLLSSQFMLFSETALPFTCIGSKAKLKGAFQGMSALHSAVLSRNSEGVVNEPALAAQWRDERVIWIKHPILTQWRWEMGIHLYFPWVLLLIFNNALAEVCVFNLILKFHILFNFSIIAVDSSFFSFLCGNQIIYPTSWSDNIAKMAGQQV